MSKHFIEQKVQVEARSYFLDCCLMKLQKHFAREQMLRTSDGQFDTKKI